MTTYDEAIGKARDIGREHGENAAAWWEQDAVGGRVTRGAEDTARLVLRGLDDGDPEVLNSLPAPDLSGEWADGYTPRDLCLACGVDWDTETAPANVPASDLCDAYELAFSEAAEEAVRAACEQTLTQ